MGRPNSGRVPAQPITRIDTRHREIMRRLLAGERQVDIAAEMNISQSRLSIVINSPIFISEFGKLEAELQQHYISKVSDISAQIQMMQPDALRVLHWIMLRDPKATLSLRRRCARDILELGLTAKKDEAIEGVLDDFATIVVEGYKIAEQRRQLQLQEKNVTPLAAVPSPTTNSDDVIDIIPEVEETLSYDTDASAENGDDTKNISDDISRETQDFIHTEIDKLDAKLDLEKCPYKFGEHALESEAAGETDATAPYPTDATESDAGITTKLQELLEAIAAKKPSDSETQLQQVANSNNNTNTETEVAKEKEKEKVEKGSNRATSVMPSQQVASENLLDTKPALGEVLHDLPAASPVLTGVGVE